jgi:hypothetical protein
MEKSEKVSKLRPSFSKRSGAARNRNELPFSGLGFDLGAIRCEKVKVRVVKRESGNSAPAMPTIDTPLPSGRWLQISLGREIRGR